MALNPEGDPEPPVSGLGKTKFYWKEIKSEEINHKDIYYGTCSTSSNVSEKVITTDDDFELRKGVIIIYKPSATNTASNVTLNVNNTGAKQIWYRWSIYSGTGNLFTGYKDVPVYYIYDGTYWVWIGSSNDNDTITGTETTIEDGVNDTKFATRQSVRNYVDNYHDSTKVDVSQTVTMTVTFEDDTTKTYIIYGEENNILIYDKAIATDYNDIWYLQGCTIDRQEDGTVFTHPTPQGFGYITLSSTGTSALVLDNDKEYEIIIDILGYTYPTFSVGLTGDDITCKFSMDELSFTMGATLKIRVTTETITFLVNDVVKQEVENDYNNYNIGYSFEMLLQGAGMAKIKDFRIKEI